MAQKTKEEYYFLTEKLEEIQWALDGKCNDIDCNKYMYKDLLKKKYKPVLSHSYSCLEPLKREKSAILGLLSLKKFKRYRFEKCYVCKKKLDKLHNENLIVSFTKPSITSKGYYEWKGYWAHRKCASKVKTPEGWKKL